MPTIAIFGAGPGLGLSAARRFADAGYQVALVARDPAKLETLAGELRARGATVTTFVADVRDRAKVRAGVEAIGERFGSPDVVLYSPGDVSRLPVSATTLDAEELETWLPLHLLTPVALAQALLPGMLRRASGSVLFALGTGARHPDTSLASVSTAQAGLLNYLHGLAAAVAPRGVYVGALLIGALIERSAAADLFDSGHFASIEPGALPRIDPDKIAQRLWEMTTARDVVEVEIP